MTRLVKLAQPGYDVKTAGDNNLIYSSQWPLMPIYLQSSFTIPDASLATTIVNHGLGYAPAFWYFSNQDITAWENGSNATYPLGGRSEFFGATGGGVIGVNETSLQYIPRASTAAGPLTIYYYIFVTNITEKFTAPITNAGQGPAGGSGSRVFKLAKPNKSADSTSLRDFAIHSDCRSPLIHSVNPGKLAPVAGLLGNSFQVDHNLGYSPMFFCYVQNFSSLESGFYELVATGSGGQTLLASSPTYVNFQNGSSGQPISILILKDPFTVSYSRSVTV